MIWNSVELKFSPFPKPEIEIIMHPRPGKDVECANTKILLEKSLSGKNTTPQKMDEARNLRKKMLRVYNSVNKALIARDMNSVKDSINDSAPFAGMIRWYLKNEYPDIFIMMQC